MNGKFRISIFVQSLVLGAMFLLAGRTAGAQVSGLAERNMSKMSNYQNECAIVKNPANKLQLFAACNNATSGLFAARSIDGGGTWIYPDPSKTIANGVNPALGPAACCDPSLAWDTFGNLYITYIDAALTDIVTLLSTDSGQHFTTLATFGPFCVQCVDQPTVVAANTTAGGAPVAVWIVWHQLLPGFPPDPNAPMLVRGAAVTGLGAVGGFTPQQSVPGTINCSYGDVAISPKGVVVQVCQNPSNNSSGGGTLVVNTKADGLGPNPFAAAVNATTTNVAAFYSIPAQSRRTIDAEAGLAYDRNPMSPHFGRLYMVYTDAVSMGSADTDIMLRFSDDDGGSWSNPPIRVNDDAPGNGKSQFLPRISSNPLSGNIAVCWHDARNSPGNNTMQEFCTIATPTGASPTFMPNAQISSGAPDGNGSNPPVAGQQDIQFGDYSGLTYFQGLAHPAWADDSNSTGDNPDGNTRYDAYTNSVTGGAAASEGDPHFSTVNNIPYGFQGAGEFVALRDYDGLEVQVRQTAIPSAPPFADPHDQLTTCVSVNTAIAARVGQHRVTYEPNLSGEPDPSGLQLRVDGVLTKLGANGMDLGEGAGVKSAVWQIEGSDVGGIEIDFPDETALFAAAKWWAGPNLWYMNVDLRHTPALEGVMGAIMPGNWLPALPDGASMGPMPGNSHQRYLDLYQKFADAWRVTDASSLFDYAPGVKTGAFTTRSWPPEQPPCVVSGMKPVQPAAPGIAERACRPITSKDRHANCIFDVNVTGETGFAKLYLASQQIDRGGNGPAGGTGGTTGAAPAKDRLAVFLDAGAAIPQGTFSNTFNTGFSLNAGLEYIFNSYVSAEGIFGYHRFPGKVAGDLNLYQVSANAKIYLIPPQNKVRPFVNGGAGGYDFSPGSWNVGGNFGGGLLFEITSHFGLQGSYNFHIVNTPAVTRFSTIQGGLRFVF